MTDCRIPTPCTRTWDDMVPQDSGRHCAHCDFIVVDLSDCSPGIAATKLRELHQRLATGEHVCVRTYVDTNRRPLLPMGRRRLLTTAMSAMLAMGSAGCVGPGPDVRSDMSNLASPVAEDGLPARRQVTEKSFSKIGPALHQDKTPPEPEEVQEETLSEYTEELPTEAQPQRVMRFRTMGAMIAPQDPTAPIGNS